MTRIANKRIAIKRWIVNILVACIVYILTTLLAYVLNIYGIRSDSPKMLYLLGVLIVVLESRNTALPLVFTVVFAVTDAWLFIDPGMFKTTFFLVSTLVFLFISVASVLLVRRLQKRSDRAKADHICQTRLLEAAEGLIGMQGKAQITEYAEKQLTSVVGKDVSCSYYVDESDPDEAKKWCCRNGKPCGKGLEKFDSAAYRYYPIRRNDDTIGVVVVSVSSSDISEAGSQAILDFTPLLFDALLRSEQEETGRQSCAEAAFNKISGRVTNSLTHNMVPRINRIHELVQHILHHADAPAEEIHDSLKTIEQESSDLSNVADSLLESIRPAPPEGAAQQ